MAETVKKKRELRYADTVKSDDVEEWIACLFLRPAAFRIVVFLYDTKVHSIHVTACFLVVGIAAALLIAWGGYLGLVLAALLIQLKSILDAADGQLARARKTPSRVGRFFDSAADFVVSLMLVAACSFLLYERTGEISFFVTGSAVFLFSEIQNSFWVYYNAYYRSISSGSPESILDESSDDVVYPYDEDKPGILAFLRTFYKFAYSWQDRLIAFLDAVSRKLAGVQEKHTMFWYGNIRFLKATGLLGLGTNLFVMSFALVLNEPSYYFVFVLCFANISVFVLLLYLMVSFARGGKSRHESRSQANEDCGSYQAGYKDEND
jgi:hypothetical protein